MQPRESLINTLVHVPPAHALEGLDAQDAEHALPSAPHSIAEIVAHLAFWQEWFTRRCHGEATPMASQAALGWPTVMPDAWPSVRERFLSGLERLAAVAEQGVDRSLSPPIEFPPLAEYTVRDVVLHVAQHNAHHLGQVVVLRQLMGRWPPPSGGWTW